ncbi:transporter substrate-binding domain-containing protein [Aminobacter ciceronei]|uniref:Polar amino acid transport system substrate-binding protein n=1 Tax=Aminobacter ciceronei TaxID=150723 RepID=A0ABR6CFM8_9HYPH|nr:transporter substrate-binding domain-containing protein [Aminobacter ciceronei]MBA8909939.1 polar amino acid transport system substrate-binding protein [Aminobacter ciceronei]MBA9023711.1 polar amino acid transport system substrate-binding protein [Aminobacter ciceronei]
MKNRAGITLGLISGFMGAMLSGGAFAQEVQLPQKFKDAGVVNVGIELTYPPMGYSDPETKKPTGVNIELLHALEAKLGTKFEYVNVSFAQIVPGLTTGRLDFHGGSLNDFPFRRDNLSFLDFFKSGPQFFVRDADSKDIQALADLCGRSVGNARYLSVFSDVIKQVSKSECVDKGKEPIKEITEDLPVQLGLLQKRYDAAIVTTEALVYAKKLEPNKFRNLGGVVREWRAGMVFSKNSAELRDAVQAAMNALIADGTYSKVLAKYGIADSALATTSIDAGEL